MKPVLITLGMAITVFTVSLLVTLALT